MPITPSSSTEAQSEMMEPVDMMPASTKMHACWQKTPDEIALLIIKAAAPRDLTIEVYRQHQSPIYDSPARLDEWRLLVDLQLTCKCARDDISDVIENELCIHIDIRDCFSRHAPLDHMKPNDSLLSRVKYYCITEHWVIKSMVLTSLLHDSETLLRGTFTLVRPAPNQPLPPIDVAWEVNANGHADDSMAMEIVLRLLEDRIGRQHEIWKTILHPGGRSTRYSLACFAMCIPYSDKAIETEFSYHQSSKSHDERHIATLGREEARLIGLEACAGESEEWSEDWNSVSLEGLRGDNEVHGEGEATREA